MIPHLQGREKNLEPFGWTGRDAEWISLVCLHSGIFTRDQLGAFFGASRFSVRRFVQSLTAKKLTGRLVAGEETRDGRLVCRIFGREIYSALGAPHIRHRRDGAAEVMRRRLLSLDYVLEHRDLAWLPTEAEKVAGSEALDIPRADLPQRIYAGKAGGTIRYFNIKMPVALGDTEATFCYIDPGHATVSELQSWGEAHLNLWRRLRAGGRQVRVVAVAWVGKDSQDEDSPDTLRKAIAEGDWETIEQHGGLNEVMSKTGKRAEGGRIDGFTLWRPERCRQIGAHSTKAAWCAEVVRGTEPSRRRHASPPLWPAFPARYPNPHR